VDDEEQLLYYSSIDQKRTFFGFVETKYTKAEWRALPEEHRNICLFEILLDLIEIVEVPEE
jgi:hypothetical protein